MDVLNLLGHILFSFVLHNPHWFDRTIAIDENKTSHLLCRPIVDSQNDRFQKDEWISNFTSAWNSIQNLTAIAEQQQQQQKADPIQMVRVNIESLTINAKRSIEFLLYVTSHTLLVWTLAWICLYYIFAVWSTVVSRQWNLLQNVLIRSCTRNVRECTLFIYFFSFSLLNIFFFEIINITADLITSFEFNIIETCKFTVGDINILNCIKYSRIYTSSSWLTNFFSFSM